MHEPLNFWTRSSVLLLLAFISDFFPVLLAHACLWSLKILLASISLFVFPFKAFKEHMGLCVGQRDRIK